MLLQQLFNAGDLPPRERLAQYHAAFRARFGPEQLQHGCEAFANHLVFGQGVVQKQRCTLHFCIGNELESTKVIFEQSLREREELWSR